jgi:hypothetical protein
MEEGLASRGGRGRTEGGGGHHKVLGVVPWEEAPLSRRGRRECVRKCET